MKKRHKTLLDSFVGFCIIGISNTVIFYAVNIFCLYILSSIGESWDFIAANIAAFIFSVIWSFYWNRKLVFHREHEPLKSIIKALGRSFVSYSFCGIFLNNLLSYFWIYDLNISKSTAPLLNIFITTPINFFLNYKWTFQQQ